MASLVVAMNLVTSLFFFLFRVYAIESAAPYEDIVKVQEQYKLPDLPYAYDGLEPFIDEATVRVHHLGHHAAYTKKMNAALKDWRESGVAPKLSSKSIAKILDRINFVPSDWRHKIRSNGGGFVNHALYWAIMSPNPNKGERKPSGKIAKLIDESFGSFSNFKDLFSRNALDVFGSGYTWLCMEQRGGLRILGTTNQESPLGFQMKPVLVIDVWEHAYYLKYQNRRSEYVESFWNVVNWDAVNELVDWWPSQRMHDEL